MEEFMALETPLVVMGSLFLSWKIIKHIWSALDVEKDPVTVLVTGAAGMHACFIFVLYILCFIKFYNFLFQFLIIYMKES